MGGQFYICCLISHQTASPWEIQTSKLYGVGRPMSCANSCINYGFCIFTVGIRGKRYYTLFSAPYTLTEVVSPGNARQHTTRTTSQKPVLASMFGGVHPGFMRRIMTRAYTDFNGSAH
jgi:hypothetical protein